jgi:hypothetical protein
MDWVNAGVLNGRNQCRASFANERLRTVAPGLGGSANINREGVQSEKYLCLTKYAGNPRG